VYNEIIGSGRYDWPDDSWYEGEVYKGLRHGKGVYETGKKEIKYTGEW